MTATVMERVAKGRRGPDGRVTLTEIGRIGTEIIDRLFALSDRQGLDPYSRGALNTAIDLWFDLYLPEDHTPIELAALTAYVEAALGHRRLQRRRFLVWMDEDGRLRYCPPPWRGDEGLDEPEKPMTETLEQYLRRQGAPIRP